MALRLAFSRLCLRTPSSSLGTTTIAAVAAPPCGRRLIATTAAAPINVSAVLCAEPLKKKKRIDPAIIKAREERRRKKVEKQIRRLEKNARQLKPIDEMEVPLVLIDERAQRTRTGVAIDAAVLEQRALLEKAWARHKQQEKLAQYQQLDRLIGAQEKALLELRYESEALHAEAIQPDFGLLPFVSDGPVATPAQSANYDSPDGEYVDVSKKWE